MPRLIRLRDGRAEPAEDAFTHVADDQDLAPGDVIEFDHITPLWLGGENRESNLQAVIGEAHKRKTAVEAGIRSKVKANTKKHLGIKSKRPTGLSHPYLKKKMNGQVIDTRTGEVVG